MSYHADVCHGWLLMEDDGLGGQVTLQRLLQLFRRAVVTRVWPLVPVVRVPSNNQPHIPLPVQLFFVCLQKTLVCDKGPEGLVLINAL